VPAAVPEPGQDRVGLVTSLRHPQRAMALARERKQLSPHRQSQQTLALSARGGAGGTTSGNLSFPYTTRALAAQILGLSTTHRSGQAVERPSVSSRHEVSSSNGDSGDVVQTRCGSRHVEAESCAPRLDRAHKQSLGATLSELRRSSALPGRAVVCGGYPEFVTRCRADAGCGTRVPTAKWSLPESRANRLRAIPSHGRCCAHPASVA
jgi:hypothetical protein